MNAVPQHILVTVAASAQVGATSARRLMKVVVGGQTTSRTVKFYDSEDNSGTVLLTVSALADSSAVVDLRSVGGLQFATAMYCELSGASAIAYVWYE